MIAEFRKGPGTEHLSDTSQPTAIITPRGENVESNLFVKGPGREPVRSFVVVFSGGEKRERDYFRYLELGLVPGLKLYFYASAESLDKLWLMAKGRLSLLRSGAGNEPDHIYLLTDVDDFRNKVLKIRYECEQTGVILVVSNPCFEVWLYYSKRSDRFIGFKMPDDRLKFSKNVKRFLHERTGSGVDPRKALFDLPQNISNARRNYEVDEDGLPCEFATQMFLVGEELLRIVDVEALHLRVQQRKNNQ